MPEDTLEPKLSTTAAPPERKTPREGKTARSTGLRVLIWLLILFAFGLLFWAVLHHNETVAKPSGRRSMMGGTVTLTTAIARKGDIGVYLQAIGTVTPVHTDTITSQASGMITKVNYTEGQIVRRGEQLVQIDPRPYAAQVLAAQGALERDTSLLAQSRMDLERYRAAWKRNAIAKQTMEDEEKIVMQQEGTVKADQGTARESVACGQGGYALAGGMRTAKGRSANIEMQESFPDTPSSWTVSVLNRGDKRSGDASVKLYAVCIKK